MKLRTGRHNHQLVYVQHGDTPADTDPMFAVCFDTESAALIVDTFNERERAAYERGKADGGRSGYDQAVTVLRDVAQRTGSTSARYWADYLAVDPDRLAPAAAPVGSWETIEQPEPDLTARMQAIDPEEFRRESLGTWPDEQPEPEGGAR